MAKVFTAPFVQTYQNYGGRISVALTNVDLNVSTVGAVEIATAGAEGSKISTLYICAQGVTVASRLLIYEFNGTTYKIVRSSLITAITPSTIVAEFQQIITFDDLVLKSGHKLFAGVSAISGAIDILTIAGDY